MKLIYCTECGDVVRLHRRLRSCLCGRSRGRYLEDTFHALIAGPCVPLAFSDVRFKRALDLRSNNRRKHFPAYVMEHDSVSVNKLDR